VPDDQADLGHAGRRDRLVLPPPAEGGPNASDNSFPSEAELLRQPTVWERAMRRLPVAAAGEAVARKSPAPPTRERRRALLRFGVLIAIIVLVGGGLWFATMRDKSPGKGSAGTTTAAAPTLIQVRPSAVAASTQSGSRVASNVVDGKLGTFWSRLVPSEDDHPFLRFSFTQPVRLGRVQIASGAAGAEFARRPRPQEIELQFSDGTTLRTTLADKTGFQTVNFRPRQVDGMRMVVLSTYPSSGPQRTSLTEVRFFAVRS
jgi:F5/8 type C domain